MAIERYTFMLGGLPITIPKPEQRIKQAEALIKKYLEPKIQIEKVTFKISPEDLKKFIPYLILGVGGFILFLKVIK